jgi:hypothetical protein
VTRRSPALCGTILLKYLKLKVYRSCAGAATTTTVAVAIGSTAAAVISAVSARHIARIAAVTLYLLIVLPVITQTMSYRRSNIIVSVYCSLPDAIICKYMLCSLTHCSISVHKHREINITCDFIYVVSTAADSYSTAVTVVYALTAAVLAMS